MNDAVIREMTTRVQWHHTNPSSASFGLQCWEVWCILPGSTLDSGNLVSHSATVFRMFESSSTGHAVINNCVFTFGTQQGVCVCVLVCVCVCVLGGVTACFSPVTQLLQWTETEIRKGNIFYCTSRSWLGTWKYFFFFFFFFLHDRKHLLYSF